VPVELSANVLRSALAALERRDPQAATDAKDAVESLAWRESEDEPVVFGQHDLQVLLWYVLPNKWDAPDDELVAVARALGELLEAAGAPARYVALCHSRETEQVIRSGGEGFVELMESSGLEPPDTQLFKWSDLMTVEESDERRAASHYLEDAIERGELEPGSPGWPERQQEVIEAFLATPDESGGTPLGRIRAARIEGWLGPPTATDELGGDRRSRLVALLPLLEQEPNSEQAAQALDPLLWLLDLCAEGARLTQTNALARSIAREAIERFPGWWDPEFPGLPYRELDVYPLAFLHEFALDLGLVRRRRRELRLSRRGRELRADPPALLRLVAGELADTGFGTDVGLAVALAEADGAIEPPELPILVALEVEVLASFAGLSGRAWERRTLTEGGRTLALAILRARATGPSLAAL
jgi:hypothetical protein